MSTIIPESELLKKAVKWISDQLQEDPTLSYLPLINQAAMRFNLSPRDTEFLIRFYRKRAHESS